MLMIFDMLQNQLSEVCIEPFRSIVKGLPSKEKSIQILTTLLYDPENVFPFTN